MSITNSTLGRAAALAGSALIGLGHSLCRQHRSAVVVPSAPTATVASVLPVR